MKECEFWQKKQKLDLLMGQENGFARAYTICQELWEQLCASSWSQEGKWQETALAVMIILRVYFGPGSI